MQGDEKCFVETRYVSAIRDLGYEHLGAHGIPGRDYFRRGSPRLLFRDWLRQNESAALEYAVLKRDLHAQFADDRLRYSESKGPFIKALLRRARGAMSGESRDDDL